MNLEAIVLAGGNGERMGDLTKDKPKHLLEVNGRALIDYPMKILFDSKNIERIILHVQEKYKNKYVERFGDGTEKIKVDYNTAFNPRIIDALKNDVDKLKTDSFILLFGDAITDINIDKVIDYYRKLNEEKYNVIIISPKTYQVIDSEIHKNIIKSFFTRKKESYEVCGAILNKKDINWNIVGDNLDVIYNDLSKRKKLKAYRFFGYYKNINTYKDLIEAENDIKNGKTSSFLWVF